MMPHTARKSKGVSIIDFLRPHWKSLTLALLAVAGETAADLLDPWPLKIVLDYLLQSKHPPSWMSAISGWMGQDKLVVLNFAVVAVAAIALASSSRTTWRRSGAPKLSSW